MSNLERSTTTKKKGDTVQMQEVYNQQRAKRQGHSQEFSKGEGRGVTLCQEGTHQIVMSF